MGPDRMKPVASMTGFASSARPTALGPLTLDLRSVNARFLDLALRLPDELRGLEPMLRETIAGRLARGKVECRISVARGATAAAPRLDADALKQLATLANEVQRSLPGVQSLSAADVLQWPGVVDMPGSNPDALRSATAEALGEALDALTASRQREGAALRDALLAACDRIDAIAGQLAARAPELLAAVERKLAERLEAALGEALSNSTTVSREEVTDRIRQEVTLYGMRMDVEEEIKRLQTHVAEVRRVLGAGGPVGRRLDFLMQELNRESNTIGSKAAAIEMTNASIELKLTIEQMREQIQNLE
jgi:uncharacterized protein (TIGR00255 family)